MTETILFSMIYTVTVFGVGFLVGKAFAEDRVREEPVHPLVQAAQDAVKEASEPFPVAGKAKRVPWTLRRRELEANARTKRKAVEEFRGL